MDRMTWTDFQVRQRQVRQVRATDRRHTFVLHCFTQPNEIRICPSERGFCKSERYAFLRDKSERNDRNHTRGLYDKEFKRLRKFFRAIRKRWRYTIQEMAIRVTKDASEEHSSYISHFMTVLPRGFYFIIIIKKKGNKLVKLNSLLFARATRSGMTANSRFL